MQNTISAPHVFDFLDVSQYLQNYFFWRKSTDPGFTYSEWAEELSIGSKTVLRFILKKKRNITPKSAKAFKANLNLLSEQAEYFDILIKYSQAGGVSEKNLYGKMLMGFQRRQYQQTEVPTSVAVQDVYGPVILTLLTFKDFIKTPEALADLLGIERGIAQDILQSFVEAGLVVVGPDGSYSYSHTAFKINNGPGHPNLKKYHAYWLDQAKVALHSPVETRNYRSLKFALSPEEYKQVLDLINEYAVSLLSRFHCENISSRRLYMYETALFPVSLCLAEKEMELHL